MQVLIQCPQFLVCMIHCSKDIFSKVVCVCPIFNNLSIKIFKYVPKIPLNGNESCSNIYNSIYICTHKHTNIWNRRERQGLVFVIHPLKEYSATWGNSHCSGHEAVSVETLELAPLLRGVSTASPPMRAPLARSWEEVVLWVVFPGEEELLAEGHAQAFPSFLSGPFG